MYVVIYTTTSEIEHTEADRVAEHGSFLCVYEGDVVFKYNTAFITHVVEAPEKINTEVEI
jgi:hypothetical protein